jgi:hypothetical protein
VITVTADAGCAWTANSNTPWISASAGGDGNGSADFTVDANGGGARSGTIAIAGRSFTVTQDAAPAPAPVCTFSVSPTSISVKKKGGDEKVKVTAPAGCGWTASSNTGWISVKSIDGGPGNGTVTLSVDKNDDTLRSGTATVAGQTVTVTQGKDDEQVVIQ